MKAEPKPAELRTEIRSKNVTHLSLSKVYVDREKHWIGVDLTYICAFGQTKKVSKVVHPAAR